MTHHTFALITSEATHYVDVSRPEGDERAWRDIVIEQGLTEGLITPSEAYKATAIPAARPAPPSAYWR